MSKKLTLTTIAILITFISAKAQDEPKVIIFRPTSDSEEPYEDKDPALNSIRVGLVEAFYGSYGIYYERAVAKKFSLESGIGVTFSNTIMELEDRFRFKPISESPEYFTYNYGRMFSFGAKYYLDEVFDEYYFAFSYFNRSYLWDHFPNGDKGRTLTYNESYKITAPQLLFGYSWVGDYGLVLDTYGGIGFTKFSAKIYSPDSDKLETYTESVPTFRFGMKLGIVF